MYRRRNDGFAAFVSFALVAISTPTHAATVDVTTWNPTDDPFDTGSANTSISASAILDLQTGVRANLRANCTEGQVEFVIGIANGSVEPFDGNAAKIALRLDNYGSDARVVSLTGNANRFSFVSYKSSYLASGTQFLIGIPMNGTTDILRISLKQDKVASFLAQCLATQRDIEKVQKAAEAKVEQERPAKEAAIQAEKARVDAEQRQREATIKSDNAVHYAWTKANVDDMSGDKFCKAGQSMHISWPGDNVYVLPPSARNYLDGYHPGKVIPHGTKVQTVGPGLPRGGGYNPSGGLMPYCRVRNLVTGEIVMVNVLDLIPD